MEASIFFFWWTQSISESESELLELPSKFTHTRTLLWSVGAKQHIPYNNELWVEVHLTKISIFIAGVPKLFPLVSQNWSFTVDHRTKASTNRSVVKTQNGSLPWTLNLFFWVWSKWFSHVLVLGEFFAWYDILQFIYFRLPLWAPVVLGS